MQGLKKSWKKSGKIENVYVRHQKYTHSPQGKSKKVLFHLQKRLLSKERICFGGTLLRGWGEHLPSDSKALDPWVLKIEKCMGKFRKF